MLGPYKLSLHSGSDKLSMYPALARATKGRFHVKTAGTSYLEALRVVARHDPALFRRIINFARGRYDKDKATYHVSATLQLRPAGRGESPTQSSWSGTTWNSGPTCRRAGVHSPGAADPPLHVRLGPDRPRRSARRCGVLDNISDTYTEVLADHFSRHLDALRAGIVISLHHHSKKDDARCRQAIWMICSA